MAKESSTRRIFEIKSVGDDGEGTFTGLLSPYGLVDLVKDRVMKGAFTKTIKDNGGSVPILYQHDDAEPIGTMELLDTEAGLQVKGKLLLDDDVPVAKKAYKLIKNKVVKGLSIGFKAIKSDPRDDEGIRNIREVKLYEGSIVTFPAAPEAQILEVKRISGKSMGDGIGDFAEELDEAQTACAGGQIIRTLEDCLYPVWWNLSYDYDGDLAEDLPANLQYIEAIFDQAKEAFLAAAAKYGNMTMKGDPDDMKMLATKARMAWKAPSAGPEETKALTKKVAGEDLPASAFLVVGDPSKTDTWKLPVKFSTDAKSKSHIRAALARISQVEGVPSDVLAKAKTKLEALAKDHGIDVATASKGEPIDIGDAVADTEPCIEVEVKKGKKVSQDTAMKLKSAHAQIKSAGSMLEALYTDNDESGTPGDIDGTAATSNDDEPGDTHSTEPAELKNVLNIFASLTGTAA